MKKIATLLFATAALSISASAGTITTNCTLFPTQFNSGSGSGTISCPGYTPIVGQVLQGAALSLYADYTFGGSSNDVLVTFTIAAPAGVTWASSSVGIDVLGGFSSSSSNPAVPVSDGCNAGCTAANFASAFNVGITSSIVSGSAGTSSAGVQVTYTYGSATPEPGSIALMGSGLIGLAIAGRKRFGR